MAAASSLYEPPEARALDPAERLDWLRLARSENVGPITFRRLIARFGTAACALARLPELARNGGARQIRIAPSADAAAELDMAARLGGRVIAACEPDYPPLLARTEDCPPVLHALGNVPLAAKRAVAVVGARNASLNGQKLAEQLAAAIGAGGYLVVSGLARGIDAAAHRGALGSGTAAVVAGGIDVIYPAENQALYERIRAEGLLLAEQAPGTRPQPRDFPRRNRIIAGMARATLVVEASPRSGSLITARMALDYAREVMAVPGSPLDGRARGANQLIREGALLVETGDDVLNALAGPASRPLADPQGPDFIEEPTDEPSPAELQAARLWIGSALGPSPVAVDELVRHGQFSPATAATILLELELAGRLERHPGNQVALIEPEASFA